MSAVATRALAAQETAVLDLEWTQGDAVSFALRFVGLSNLAAYAWRSEIRRGNSRGSTLFATFDVDVAVMSADLVVSLSLQPSANSGYAERLWYDVQSDDGASDVRTWVRGRVLLHPDVTIPTVAP